MQHLSSRSLTLCLIAFWLLIAAGCAENDGQTDQTTVTTVPPAATAELNSTMPADPTVTSRPTATRQLTFPPRDDILHYTSNDNLLSITFPREWIFTDFQTLFLATNPTLINKPGFQSNGGLIMIISDLNNEIVRDNAQTMGSATELLNSYILSGALNQFGANFRLLEDIQSNQIANRSTAKATLSTTSTDGEIGLVFLTALAEGERRVIIASMTVEDSLGRYANPFETIANSLTFVELPQANNGVRPTLNVNGLITGNWIDGPTTVDIVLQANSPVLAVLVMANDSDGILLLENRDGTVLQQSDFADIGQPEAMRIEVTSGERYTLRVRERTRTLGQYQIILVNLGPPSLTLEASETREVVGLGKSEYVLQPVPGATYLIYAEPLGPNILLQDATLSVADTNNNLLAEADNAYLSEPEVLLFTAPANISGEIPENIGDFLTISIADFFGQSGSFRLHIHRLVDPGV